MTRNKYALAAKLLLGTEMNTCNVCGGVIPPAKATEEAKREIAKKRDLCGCDEMTQWLQRGTVNFGSQ